MASGSERNEPRHRGLGELPGQVIPDGLCVESAAKMQGVLTTAQPQATQFAAVALNSSMNDLV